MLTITLLIVLMALKRQLVLFFVCTQILPVVALLLRLLLLSSYSTEYTKLKFCSNLSKFSSRSLISWSNNMKDEPQGFSGFIETVLS